MALPTIPPAGCWTGAEDRLARALISLQSVLNFLRYSTPEEAAAGNVYIDAMLEPESGDSYSQAELEAYYPNVVLGSPGDDTDAYVRRKVGAPMTFAPTGVIEVFLQQRLKHGATNPVDVANEDRSFKNHIDRILPELESTVVDYLDFQELSVPEFSRSSNKSKHSMGVIQVCRLRALWGRAGSE